MRSSGGATSNLDLVATTLLLDLHRLAHTISDENHDSIMTGNVEALLPLSRGSTSTATSPTTSFVVIV